MGVGAASTCSADSGHTGPVKKNIALLYVAPEELTAALEVLRRVRPLPLASSCVTSSPSLAMPRNIPRWSQGL